MTRMCDFADGANLDFEVDSVYAAYTSTSGERRASGEYPSLFKPSRGTICTSGFY